MTMIWCHISSILQLLPPEDIPSLPKRGNLFRLRWMIDDKDVAVHHHLRCLHALKFWIKILWYAYLKYLSTLILPHLLLHSHVEFIWESFPKTSTCIEVFFFYVFLFFFFELIKLPYPFFCLQVWLYNIGLGSLVYRVEKVCDVTGEDPTCSRWVFPFVLLW